MIVKSIATLLLSTLVFSCSPLKHSDRTDIPYETAKNYFVKNDVKDIGAFKISSQTELDAKYGIGRTMSENSKPTVIDFGKSFAIAVIAPTSDNISKIHIEHLQKGNDSLYLQYKIEHGAKQSFTSTQTQLLIVDKQYDLPLSILDK